MPEQRQVVYWDESWPVPRHVFGDATDEVVEAYLRRLQEEYDVVIQERGDGFGDDEEANDNSNRQTGFRR